MRDRPRGEKSTSSDSSSRGRGGGSRSVIPPVIAWAVLILAGGVIAMRLTAGPRLDPLLGVAVGAVAILLAFRILSRKRSVPASPRATGPALQEIFDSA